MADHTVTTPAWELRHRLRRALEIGELTPTEMAEFLEVHENTVSNYLSGRTTPKSATIRAWALRCGIPYEWLVEESPRIDGLSESVTPATAA